MKQEDRAREVLAQQRVADGLREAPSGLIPRDTAIRAMLAFATPTPVIETEGSGEAGLRDALVSYALQYGPRCRDCADEDGVCPNNGMGCGDRRKATEYVVGALMYGARHGFCPAALAAERPTDREAVAKDISRIAGCQVGSERTRRIVDYILALRPVGADNVRERALEEAAKVADAVAKECRADERKYEQDPDFAGAISNAQGGWIEAGRIAKKIRALITPTAGNREDGK